MNQMYGFDGEVKSKYTAQMAELFTEVYNWLPLAHCLNNRVLVSFVFYINEIQLTITHNFVYNCNVFLSLR